LIDQRRAFGLKIIMSDDIRPVIWTFSCGHKFATVPTTSPLRLDAKVTQPVLRSSTEKCSSFREPINAAQEATIEQRRKDARAVEIWKAQIDVIKQHIVEAKEENLEAMGLDLEQILKNCTGKWMGQMSKVLMDEMEVTNPHGDCDLLQKSLDENLKRLISLENIVGTDDDGALMDLQMKGRLTTLRKKVGYAQDLYNDEVEIEIHDLEEVLVECLRESKAILEEVIAKIDD
jgi:hypothetical protein